LDREGANQFVSREMASKSGGRLSGERFEQSIRAFDFIGFCFEMLLHFIAQMCHRVSAVLPLGLVVRALDFAQVRVARNSEKGVRIERFGGGLVAPAIFFQLPYALQFLVPAACGVGQFEQTLLFLLPLLRFLLGNQSTLFLRTMSTLFTLRRLRRALGGRAPHRFGCLMPA
jgi:hypothetical protein